MPDEPTLGELKRTMEAGFASVNASLAKVVSQEVFLAEQRRVDERHAAQAADTAEEKAERISADKDEKAERVAADKEIRTEVDKLRDWLKWVAAVVIIPLVLFVANIVIELNKTGKP